MYKVYGNFGDSSETVLYACNDLDEAIRWSSEYVRWGDYGGFSIIEVVSHRSVEEGREAIEIHWVRTEEDYH